MSLDFPNVATAATILSVLACGGRIFADKGCAHDLWGTVNQNGVVVAILVPPRRERPAPECFFRHLLQSTETAPHTLITDRLRSNLAAFPRVLPKARHKRGHGLHNRAETSYQPTREREAGAAFNHCSKPNHFSRFTGRWLLCSESDGIASQQLTPDLCIDSTFVYGTTPTNKGTRHRSVTAKPMRS